MATMVHVIVGARPNQMKAAPLLKALRSSPDFHPVLVDTGQHYDHEMAGIFMEQFSMGKPDICLEVGSASHGVQTARILERYEAILIEHRPGAVIVIGDVNSTVACTLAAAKLGIFTVHLEAGLRSFDRGMPEELNRMVTDVLVDLLWTPSPDGDDHLRAMGVPQERIDRVGNIMIDTLVSMLPSVEAKEHWRTYGVPEHGYAVVTLHRPSNVDQPEVLSGILDLLLDQAQSLPMVWPLHPRTRARIEALGRLDEVEAATGLHLTPPLGYLEFMSCVASSRCVITDSGGIQEETTWLGVPCLTLRPNTERPITLTEGTNVLTTPSSLREDLKRALEGPIRHDVSIDLWDGGTAERCVTSLRKHLR